MYTDANKDNSNITHVDADISADDVAVVDNDNIAVAFVNADTIEVVVGGDVADNDKDDVIGASNGANNDAGVDADADTVAISVSVADADTMVVVAADADTVTDNVADSVLLMIKTIVLL